MIAVIVPAHDEADQIEACLASIAQAARHPLLRDEKVQCFVALDACTDRTGYMAHRHGASLVVLNLRNVGAARALGARAALAAGARWLAFTDADSVVASDWLVAQVDLRADAVCGAVMAHDWRGRAPGVGERHQAAYPREDGHHRVEGQRSVDGVNLGVSAAAYLRAGGFEALSCNGTLVSALRDAGVDVVQSTRPRVWSHARREPKAAPALGLGANLSRLDDGLGGGESIPMSKACLASAGFGCG